MHFLTNIYTFSNFASLVSWIQTFTATFCNYKHHVLHPNMLRIDFEHIEISWKILRIQVESSEYVIYTDNITNRKRAKDKEDKKAKKAKRPLGKKKLQCGSCKRYFHLECGNISEVDVRVNQAQENRFFL